MTTQTIDLKRFKDAVGFTATFRKWGNRRKGNMAKVETDADKSRLRLVKELIVSEEYADIGALLGELRRWIYVNTVPSFFKEGFQLTGLGGVEGIEKRMRDGRKELAAEVEKLVAVFPAKVEDARVKLGEQFNPLDYPTAEQLREMFSIDWNWIAFTVPEGLPAELRKAEEDKLQRQFADAGEQILLALRTGFAELIAHAVDKLTVEPGAKPKVFRDSLIGNIQEFIDTFAQRNLMNDADLANLVSRAKQVLIGVSPQKLRDYANVKDNTRTQFEKIKTELSKMISERPVRKFDLDFE